MWAEFDKGGGGGWLLFPEHICSIIGSLLHNSHGTQRQRLLGKFMENDHEKVRVAVVCSVLAVVCSVLAVVCSVPAVVCSVPAVVCSVLAVVCSVLAVVCSVLAVVCSVPAVVCSVQAVVCSVPAVMCSVPAVVERFCDVLCAGSDGTVLCCYGLCGVRLAVNGQYVSMEMLALLTCRQH